MLSMADLYDKLTQFEEYYHYLESSFVDITRIIPLENEPDTFSPRLYEILQSTCSQIDGILNLMYDEYMLKKELDTDPCEDDASIEKEQTSTCKDVQRKNSTAAATYEFLNQEGVISSRVLIHKIRSGWKETRPFLCDFECVFLDEDADPHENATHNRMPKWWNAYNESKHGLPEGYKAGSIRNTYLALAGLYVLHIMTREYPREAYAFTKKDRWETSRRIAYGSTKNPYPKPIIAKPSSEIFISKIMFLNGG